MDILLIGSMGSLMRRMVEKLHKEGHRIFVLTQEGKETPGYRKVFETYRFSYDNACIREVFVSVKPAVTIFFGPYDKSFSWAAGMNTPVTYTSGLLNILMSFAALRQGRFLYLSSQQVFDNLKLTDDFGIDRSGCTSEKAQAVAMGEKMCLDYGQMTLGDVMVLRMEDLYTTPEDASELDNVCAQMCMEALDLGEIKVLPGRSIRITDAGPLMDLQEESIQVLEEKVYYPLHLMDAVEYIYQLMTVEKHRARMYQIAGDEPVTCRQMAEWIATGMKMEGKDAQEIAVIESMGDAETNAVLDGSACEEEFGWKAIHSPSKTIPALAAYIRKNAGKLSRRSDRTENALERFLRMSREVIRAAIPFVENLICFIPFFMLNNRATDSEYFRHLDFYLLYVLLFAIVHGQQQAIFSSLLAIAGYCFRQMYYRSGFDVMLDYSTYVWMAQLLILGLVVGYMKDRLRSIREENANEVEFLTRQLADMSDINGSNVRVKDVLSDQLVNQNDSVGKIYEITSGLEQHEPQEVLFYAADVLTKVMHCKDVAIYTIANEEYARLNAATSELARSLGNSLHYKRMEEMYKVLCEKKVYINKNMNQEYPLMANAIFSGEEMQIIIMVWGLSWERMTLGQANILSITGYLIQNAVLRASRYMEVLQSQRYIRDTHILEKEAFAQLVSAFLRARKRGLTQCALVNVDTQGLSLENIDRQLCQLVRSTDYIGVTESGRTQLLLANSGSSDAEYVLKRIQEAGLACWMEEETA